MFFSIVRYCMKKLINILNKFINQNFNSFFKFDNNDIKLITDVTKLIIVNY
jgi:hypothetical protein